MFDQLHVLDAHPADTSDPVTSMSVMLDTFNVDGDPLADQDGSMFEAMKPVVDPSAIELLEYIDLSSPATSVSSSSSPFSSLRRAKIVQTKRRAAKARLNSEIIKARRRDQTREASRRFRSKQRDEGVFLTARLEELEAVMHELQRLRQRYWK